jgi:hypothetical protein
LRRASNQSLSRRIDERLTNFQRFELGRRIVYLRRDCADRAPAIVVALDQLVSAEGSGNRQSGFTLKLADGYELFVRLNRRGGLARLFSQNLYLGMRGRPLRELVVATEALRRGIPVNEPVGAMVERVAPIVYRGAFLTRALTGMTLWEFVRTDDDPHVRMHVIERARQAIDRMHREGLFHADLNLHNLFVTKSGERFVVVILDLDKARLLQRPLSAPTRERNLARLRRSARKLDPDGHYLGFPALQLLAGK